jgi:hypothetical protein
VTEIRVNVVPGKVRKEQTGRILITEVEFDLIPMESAEETIEFETVGVRPVLESSHETKPGHARRHTSSSEPRAIVEETRRTGFLHRAAQWLRGR